MTRLNRSAASRMKTRSIGAEAAGLARDPGPHDRCPAVNASGPRPAARRTDHGNGPSRQRPHLPRGIGDRLKQPANST